MAANIIVYVCTMYRNVLYSVLVLSVYHCYSLGSAHSCTHLRGTSRYIRHPRPSYPCSSWNLNIWNYNSPFGRYTSRCSRVGILWSGCEDLGSSPLSTWRRARPTRLCWSLLRLKKGRFRACRHNHFRVEHTRAKGFYLQMSLCIPEHQEVLPVLRVLARTCKDIGGNDRPIYCTVCSYYVLAVLIWLICNLVHNFDTIRNLLVCIAVMLFSPGSMYENTTGSSMENFRPIKRIQTFLSGWRDRLYFFLSCKKVDLVIPSSNDYAILRIMQFPYCCTSKHERPILNVN